MGLNPRSTVVGVDDPSWRVSREGKGTERSITLDVSAFTKADHFPDGWLPSGIPLVKIAETGLYGPFAGTGACDGFLAEAVYDVLPDEDRTAALCWRGVVAPALLPDPDALTETAKTALASRFRFE